MKLQGIYTPVLTSFDPDRNVDYQAWKPVLDNQINAGVHGLIIGGSTENSMPCQKQSVYNNLNLLMTILRKEFLGQPELMMSQQPKQMRNSVIVKLAEATSMTTLKVAELTIEAGIPAGVFNVLPGLGLNVGEPLGLHQDVDVVSFTGSTATGRHFLNYSALSNLKRVVL